MKRAAKKVEDAEAAVAMAEEEIAQIELRIANGETEGDIFELHQKKTRELETAMSLWELAEQEHTDLKETFKIQSIAMSLSESLDGDIAHIIVMVSPTFT